MNMYNKKTIIRSLSLVTRRDFFVVTNTAFGDAPSAHTLGMMIPAEEKASLSCKNRKQLI